MGNPPDPPDGFLAELKRRGVVRAVIGYAVIGWVVTEVAATVAPVLLLPEWIPRAVVLLIVLGFPITVWLAWAFDLTSSGLRRAAPPRAEAGSAGPANTGAAGAAVTGSEGRWGPFRYVLVGVLVVLVGTGAFFRFAPLEPSGAAGVEAPIRSIAVLPFADMSALGDQEYFSDGISEELLNVLAQVPGLQVAARTSSFAFKGSGEDVGEIGRRLNVQMLLEGSVRRDGQRIRITAQLIDAATGYHVWSQNYDRESASVLAVQDEIAAAIVDALRVRLPGGAATLPESKAEVDPEAHRLYLRGLYHWNRRRVDDFHLAIDNFRQALERQPDYARAHAGLALSYSTLTGYDNSTVAEMVPLARAAAGRALELDPTLPDAHAALGLVARRELDWASVERHLRRTLELNPRHVTAHHWLSQHLAAMGRLEEALALARRGIELDPLSPIINNNLGYLLIFARDYDLAAEALESTLELDPTLPPALGNIVRSRIDAGRYEEALDLVERQSAIFGDREEIQLLIRGLTGPEHRAAALTAIRDAVRRQPAVSGYWVAGWLARLGEAEEALDWLERGHADNHYNMPYIAVAPEFDTLHGHPRFEALIDALGLRQVPRPGRRG